MKQRNKAKKVQGPTLVHKSDKPMGVLTAYKLPADTMAKLEKWSDPKCWRCKGSGVSGWKGEGTVAVICKCTQEGLRRSEAAYEALQKQVQAKLYEAAKVEFEKTKDTAERPKRPCMACHKISEAAGDRILVPSPQMGMWCEKCQGFRTWEHWWPKREECPNCLTALVLKPTGCPSCKDAGQVPLTDGEWIKYIMLQRAQQFEEAVKEASKALIKTGTQVVLNAEGMSDEEVAKTKADMEAKGAVVEVKYPPVTV